MALETSTMDVLSFEIDSIAIMICSNECSLWTPVSDIESLTGVPQLCKSCYQTRDSIRLATISKSQWLTG